jgi:hypothetical protein
VAGHVRFDAAAGQEAGQLARRVNHLGAHAARRAALDGEEGRERGPLVPLDRAPERGTDVVGKTEQGPVERVVWKGLDYRLEHGRLDVGWPWAGARRAGTGARPA